MLFHGLTAKLQNKQMQIRSPRGSGFFVPLFGEAHLGISTFSKAETRNAVRPAGHFAICVRSLNCVAFSFPSESAHIPFRGCISAPFGERRKSHLKTVNAHLHVSLLEKRNALTRPSLCLKSKKTLTDDSGAFRRYLNFESHPRFDFF